MYESAAIYLLAVIPTAITGLALLKLLKLSRERRVKRAPIPVRIHPKDR